MVAIFPISSMATSFPSGVEIMLSASTSSTAQCDQHPTRPADRLTAPVAIQVAGPSKQRSSATSPTTVKTRSTAQSLTFRRRPPPLLLSNFFSPLIPQNLGNQKIHLPLTKAQGKRPIVNNSYPVDFPPLTAKNHTERFPTTTVMEAQVSSHTVPPWKETKETHPKKSFREAISSSWAKNVDVSFPTTAVKASTSFEGEPAFFISEEEESKLAQKFRFALIAKFNRGRPTMAIIRQDVLNAGFTGEVYVGLIDQKHIILQLQLESDSHRIWMKRIWSFRGFQANIFRWSIDFCPEKESSVVPVWTSFPLLPLHLCDKESLFAIGSTVGDPLKLDLATAAMEKVLRPSEARMCIAVDVLQPLPHRVRIGSQDKGKWQQIVYEDLPEFCTNCSKLGHSYMNCKRKKPLQFWVPKKKSDEKNKDPQTNVYDNRADVSSHQGFCNEGTQACTNQAPEVTEEQPGKNVVDQKDQFIKNLGHFLEFFNSHEEGFTELEQASFESNGERPAVADLDLDSTSQPQRIKDKEQDQIAYSCPVDEQQRHDDVVTLPLKENRPSDVEQAVGNNHVSEATKNTHSVLNSVVDVGHVVDKDQAADEIVVAGEFPLNHKMGSFHPCVRNSQPRRIMDKEDDQKLSRCSVDEHQRPEEERRSCAAPAATATAAADLGVGVTVEVVQEAAFSFSKSLLLENTHRSSGVGETVEDCPQAAPAAIAAAEPLGVGDKVEDVQKVSISGKQMESNELEDLSFALSGKQMGSTDLEGDLSLASNALARQTITQCPLSVDLSMYSIPQCPLSVNLENCNTFGQVEVQDVSNTMLQFSKSDLEIISKMDRSKVITEWEDGEPSSLFRVKSTSDLTQLEIETDSEYETEEGIPTLDICDDDDEVAIAMGVLLGGKVNLGVADFARSLSRINLEEVKKRKYGTSDRVLRSMNHAFNSDPSRATSL